MQQSIRFLPELGHPDPSESNAFQKILQFQFILFCLLIHFAEILLRVSDVLVICFSPNQTLKTMRSETKYSRGRDLATCAISPFTSRGASVEVCTPTSLSISFHSRSSHFCKGKDQFQIIK